MSATDLHAGKAQPQARPWTSPQSPQVLAMIPFVLPQVLFPGTATQVKTGQGLEVKMVFASASTDVTVKHNLGHPIQNVWAVMAPAGVFIPKVMISATTLSNTTQQVILQSDTVANPVTVVMF